MDCSPPGSSVHEIFQARILERALLIPPFPTPGDLPNPEIKSVSPGLQEFFNVDPVVKPLTGCVG